MRNSTRKSNKFTQIESNLSLRAPSRYLTELENSEKSETLTPFNFKSLKSVSILASNVLKNNNVQRLHLFTKLKDVFFCFIHLCVYTQRHLPLRGVGIRAELYIE